MNPVSLFINILGLAYPTWMGIVRMVLIFAALSWVLLIGGIWLAYMRWELRRWSERENQ